MDTKHKRKNCSVHYLISAFLQQPFYKLPVCLCNNRRREVRQFGLSNSAAQIPGFLDILLYRNRKLANTDKRASETTLPREKDKLIFITHPCATRRKGSHPLSEKAPVHIQHWAETLNVLEVKSPFTLSV